MLKLISGQPKQDILMRKVLALPELKKQHIITSYAQIRPYREGGYRIEKESIEEKNIFHNYGHAGSGVSLSYGSAFKAVNLLENQTKAKGIQCAVLGSGVLGLMTALQLNKRGKKVKIYTKKIPTFGQKDNRLMMTSQIAPGFWFPYDYLDLSELNLDQLAETSMNFFKQSISTKRFRAVKYCQTYDQIYAPKVIKRFQKLFPRSSSQVEVDFGVGVYQRFIEFTTVRIDMQLLLKELIVELVRKGVQFVPKQFRELREVLELRQNYIFNCTGYGSRYLFNDQKMRPFRGHIVQFPNPNPQLYNYIFGSKVGDDTIRIYAHQSRILLGLTKQENQKIEVDSNIVQKMLTNYQNYYQQWSSLPKAKL